MKETKITTNLQLWLSMAPAHRLKDELTRVSKEILSLAKQLARVRSLPERVRTVWLAVDSEVAKTNEDNMRKGEGRPSCRANCNACCHIHVGTNSEEVAVLADYVVERQIPVSWQRLKVQVLNERAHRKEESREWMRIPYEDRLCPFNGADKNCAVYPVRPSRCRIWTVYSPAELCNTRDNFDSMAKMLLSAGAEVVMSAYANVPGSQRGSLTELFWRHVHERNLIDRINWTDRT